MSKYFVVLDVEGYSACRPYDVGFKVADRKGNTIEEHSVAVMPAVFDNMCYKSDLAHVNGLKSAHEMAHRNIEEILNDIDNKYIKCFNIDKFFTAFVGIIQKYNIKRIWAYNCSFDKAALNRLFGDEKFSIINSMVEFCDIIPAILYTKLLDKSYDEEVGVVMILQVIHLRLLVVAKIPHAEGSLPQLEVESQHVAH